VVERHHRTFPGRDGPGLLLQQILCEASSFVATVTPVVNFAVEVCPKSSTNSDGSYDCFPEEVSLSAKYADGQARKYAILYYNHIMNHLECLFWGCWLASGLVGKY
jgi:hypothetical protein